MVSKPADGAPFHAARAKQRRARRHIRELEELIASHVAEHPITFRKTRDPATGITTNALQPPPAPEDAAPILGDIVHNARASLDLMASELARMNGKSDTGVYFPFSRDASSLEEMIKRRKFDRCGADAVGILKTLAPYHGGNVDLRALHDLDVLDKHRALIPEVEFRPTQLRFDVKRGRYLGGSYNLLFPADTPLHGREVVLAAKELVEICEGVLETFVALKAGED